MLNKLVESMFTDLKPMNNPTITVCVEMEPSELMEALARETHSEIQRIASYSGQESMLEIEVEDVLKAFKTLVYLRVNTVNNVNSDTVRSYRGVKKHFAVPVLMYQLLIPIGVAYDRDYSIEFVPETKIAGEDLLAPQEMMALSDVFRRLENHGFKVVYGIPVSEEGELQFMAMSHVKDAVLSYRTKDHPVYAFLASFFKQQQLNEITGSMCRVLYGYDSDFRYYIARLFTSINAGDRS
jgi:hypothetical protein